MIVAAFARWLDQFGTQNEVLVTAATINIVMLKKCCGRKDHIRHLRRLRHELLVHTDEEVVAGETALNLGLIRCDGNRIGILDDKRVNGTTALQYGHLAGQDCSDARLIEHAHRIVANIEPLNQCFVELKNISADVKAPPPSYCHAP